MDELIKFNINIFIVLEKNDFETIASIKNYNCKLIFQDQKGYGSALRQGIENVSTKYFCIFNADGSFDPTELVKMYNLAEKENYDLVFGSRYENNSGSDDDTIITF